MKKIVVLFTLFSATFLNSCSKIETEIDLLPIDYLTAGKLKKWNLAYYKVNGEEQLGECSKDDIIVFTKTGTFEWQKGKNLCGPNDIDIEWQYSLAPDAKSVKINNYTFQIISLDVKKLEIEFQQDGYNEKYGYKIAE